MYKHLLVTLDDTGLATEIVSQAVPFAVALGARITFFTAKSDFGSTDQGALQRTVAPDAYADNQDGSARGLLQKAMSAARAKGVECSSLITISDRPYAAILAAAESQQCDLIFMATHGRKGLGALIVGSQTQKVLANSSIPVLVATVESNQKHREEHMAVAIMQDEHRSLAAVVSGLVHLVKVANDSNTALDIPLLQSMLHYIEAFPERLHHPKEDAYLFERLGSRTNEYDAAIEELRAQHVSGGVQLKAMQDALAHYAKQVSPATLAEMTTTVNSFAQSLWEHMNMEENVILPAAQKHLRAEDWVKIYAAFSENGDPRFDTDLEEGFKRLYSRIINLARP